MKYARLSDVSKQQSFSRALGLNSDPRWKLILLLISTYNRLLNHSTSTTVPETSESPWVEAQTKLRQIINIGQSVVKELEFEFSDKDEHKFALGFPSEVIPRVGVFVQTAMLW